jgi:signal peptidase I
MASLSNERIDDFIDNDDGLATPVKRWRETLPNGVSYTTLELSEIGPFNNTPVYEVPPDHYFMIGDNRDNSADSRVLDEVGYVPFENLIGRAQIIFFSLRDGASAWQVWRWPWAIRWGRLFTIVR